MNSPSTASADLEAALGRYRCLFDQQVDGWDAFITTLMRPLPTWIWANPLRIDGDQLRELIAKEGISTEPVPWLNPWWSSVAQRAVALDAEAMQALSVSRAAPLGPNSSGSDSLGASATTAAITGAASSPIALRLPPGFKAGQRWWYCAGLAHAQEAVSQLPVTLLDVRPGQRVLDLCAAPGGKTAQLALALGNRGTLLANDFAAERIAALQGNLDRLGVLNCSTTRCDGGNYPAAAGAFDRILVDAPCSSEGTLRRNPSLVQRGGQDGCANDRRADLGRSHLARAHAGIGPERSQRMAGRQRALLRKAVQLCRPGGRIVYSTCTFAPEENELIIAEILDEQNGNLGLLPCEVPGLVAGAGVTHWQGRQLDPTLSRCLRVWPHENDTGGFFVAVLQKSAQALGLGAAEAAQLQLEANDDGWMQGLCEHYGLPASALADCRFHRQTRRGLHLVAADHRPPAAPSPQGSGLFAYRTNIRPPKLTTGAALLLGSAATHQIMELSSEQRDSYLRRELLRPEPAQIADCRPGQILVRHRGFTLGVALLHRSGDLESLFPSRWSGCTAGA